MKLFSQSHSSSANFHASSSERYYTGLHSQLRLRTTIYIATNRKFYVSAQFVFGEGSTIVSQCMHPW